MLPQYPWLGETDGLDRVAPQHLPVHARQSVLECGHTRRQVTGLGPMRGVSTRGSAGIAQNQKGTLAQDRGDAKHLAKSSHCHHSWALISGSNSNFNQ